MIKLGCIITYDICKVPEITSSLPKTETFCIDLLFEIDFIEILVEQILY
jgi:hypothetical protein